MSSLGQTPSDPVWPLISAHIENRTGLHFPPERWADLERGLTQVARDAGYRDVRAYAVFLLGRDLHTADVEALAGSLTNAETHFFRYPRAMEFLGTTFLPELIAAKRRGNHQLRIWSAGCATGEEPYTLAILLHRLIPDLADWQITIVGTDLNPQVLAKAEQGVYTDWSFRDTPAWVRPLYFLERPHGNCKIRPELKRLVEFSYHNLADDDYPSILNNTNAMDLIVCRNVLLYFAPARIPPVIRRFHRALVDGGHLVIGSVEASQIPFDEFLPVTAAGIELYRKTSDRPGAGAPRMKAAAIAPTLPTTPVAPAAPRRTPAKPAAPVPSPVPATPQELFATGCYREARAQLLAAMARSPGPTAASAMLLAHCHANLGELAEALGWCDRALALAKSNPAHHFLRASILLELHRDEEALLALRKVLYLDPDHVLAHYTLANVQRRHNRRPSAAQHLDQVRQLLAHRDEREELPESGGLTVGRLNALLAATPATAEPVETATHE